MTPSKWLAFAEQVRKGGQGFLGGGEVDVNHDRGEGGGEGGGGDAGRSDKAEMFFVAQPAGGHFAKGDRVFFII